MHGVAESLTHWTSPFANRAINTADEPAGCASDRRSSMRDDPTRTDPCRTSARLFPGRSLPRAAVRRGSRAGSPTSTDQADRRALGPGRAGPDPDPGQDGPRGQPGHPLELAPGHPDAGSPQPPWSCSTSRRTEPHEHQPPQAHPPRRLVARNGSVPVRTTQTRPFPTVNARGPEVALLAHWTNVAERQCPPSETPSGPRSGRIPFRTSDEFPGQPIRQHPSVRS